MNRRILTHDDISLAEPLMQKQANDGRVRSSMDKHLNARADLESIGHDREVKQISGQTGDHATAQLFRLNG